MTPVGLLQQLHALGVVLTALPDGTVHYKAPQGTLTPVLREAMRQQKAELHALIFPRCWHAPVHWERQRTGAVICLLCASGIFENQHPPQVGVCAMSALYPGRTRHE
jgi:hypothetical protein